MKPPKPKKPPSLREDRAIAEKIAREYADTHRQFDRFIETSLRASPMDQIWAIVAHVDFPNKTEDRDVTVAGISLGRHACAVYERDYKEHKVIVVKRKS